MKFHFVKTSMTVAIAVITVGFNVLIPTMALAASASAIDRDARASLADLYKHTPGAKALGDKAVAVLVFPSIVKGGFIIAGQFGDGALRKGGKTVAYYRSLAASYGFQAGVQAFGYVLFFMDDASLQYLDNTAGFELGDRTESGRVGRRVRQELLDHNVAERCLCFHLRPERTDGGDRDSGNEDYEDQSVPVADNTRVEGRVSEGLRDREDVQSSGFV